MTLNSLRWVFTVQCFLWYICFRQLESSWMPSRNSRCDTMCDVTKAWKKNATQCVDVAVFESRRLCKISRIPKTLSTSCTRRGSGTSEIQVVWFVCKLSPLGFGQEGMSNEDIQRTTETEFRGLRQNKLPWRTSDLFCFLQLSFWRKSIFATSHVLFWMTFALSFQLFSTLNFVQRMLTDPGQMEELMSKLVNNAGDPGIGQIPKKSRRFFEPFSAAVNLEQVNIQRRDLDLIRDTALSRNGVSLWHHLATLMD